MRKTTRSPRASWALLPLLGLLCSCGDVGLPPPDVVARVGGQELPYADFESYLLENSVDSQTGLSSDVLSSLFDQYLDEALLGRLAADEGHADERMSRAEAVRALVNASLPSDISEAEIVAFYEQHKQEFEQEETVVLRQILVEDRATARQAREAIISGIPFEEAVGDYSQGPGAEVGGMQGELGRKDLPPAMADLIFDLDVGEVSEIVAADYGFHVFQVVDRRSAAALELSQIRDVIVTRLRHRSRALVVTQLVEKARSSYNTAVYEKNLPFNYNGFRQ